MEKKMSVARGLGRLKTIEKQLIKISNEISNYGAWNNKRKSPLGDNKGTVEQTHNQAQEYINSLYQQFNDLIKEYSNIKKAIDKTNMVTKITVAGEEMTVYEALLCKRKSKGFYEHFLNSYNRAVGNAESDVQRYNLQFAKADEEVKKVAMADVSYFIDKSKIDKVNGFLNEFVSEINGLLNEINAVTELIFD